MGFIIYKYLLFNVSLSQEGQANDYQVICKDGQFGIHEYCLYNSEFLYKQHKARKNYEDKGRLE